MKLNSLERALLEKVAISEPGLLGHIPHLKVVVREKTGVGVIVKFRYLNEINNQYLLTPPLQHLSCESVLTFPALRWPVSWEVAITNGKVDFLELVANDEIWDGNVSNYEIS